MDIGSQSIEIIKQLNNDYFMQIILADYCIDLTARYAYF
jgi:hypothetical protein